MTPPDTLWRALRGTQATPTLATACGMSPRRTLRWLTRWEQAGRVRRVGVAHATHPGRPATLWRRA